MHLLVRERHGIDDQDVAEDLGHASADVVFLSFSDSDLLALERAYEDLKALSPEGAGFSLRLVSLSRLRHPMSVDLYVEQTLSEARCVVVRLLGGVDYWRYGAEEVRNSCARNSIPLALLPGDARQDARLEDWSNVDVGIHERLTGFLKEGGPDNARRVLLLMAHLAGRGADLAGTPTPLPLAGLYRAGKSDLSLRATVVFYRAHLLAADTAPIDCLAHALEEAGLSADVLYVSSLRNPDAVKYVRRHLAQTRPDIILNATFFSARGEAGASPLDQADAPVLQVLQPGSTHQAWQESGRGLSQSDLAMQVVLPELDGRLSAGPISFKSETIPGNAARHDPYPAGIAAVVAQARAWARLRRLKPTNKHLALILSDYPGAEGQSAHAVGLDTFASLCSILEALKNAGYDCGPAEAWSKTALVQSLCKDALKQVLSLEDYRTAFQALPPEFRQGVLSAWGEPQDDAAVQGKTFCLKFLTLGNITVAVQPDRGASQDRKTQYHDPDTPPRHAYVAFHIWLRQVCQTDVMIHLGTHGTLEWLPGKAVALSENCAPAALRGALPVLYPFIVNNPGEAAAAKRRLGAVTIGHMTPPVMKAELDAGVAELEQLIDEFAEADGLDRRRGAILRRDILDRASRMGLLAESGVKPGEGDEAEALARLDAYLCDVKDLQIRDGLHVFGKVAPHADRLATMVSSIAQVSKDDVTALIKTSADAEMNALLSGLEGRFVQPGPSGAPTRGRVDVLPTGRNLFTMDPRAVPTASAVELAKAQARQILLRHLQEEGEPLQRIVMDLWGSSTLRTGGEDLALALLLMGVEPVWDFSSGRVSGIEVTPLAVLDRPRVDVTLRISGLFRDAFPGQIALFDQAVQAVAAREEDEEWNSLAASVRHLEGEERKTATARIFGAAPGTYGTGIEEALARGTWQNRSELGQSYLDDNDWMYGGGRDGTRNATALAEKLARTDAILHVQDHAETDILESPDVAAHEGGLSAAAELLGADPVRWHGDTSRPEAPRLRDTEAEVARIVRGRLANPRWLEGMQRHDYRGAAEIARGLDGLCAFAATLPTRFDHQFDLVFAATLGNDTCDKFLQNVNPQARQAMRERFQDMIRRGLWHPRLNSVAALLEDGQR
ncbi:cobaltochelatase subunit CobN [Gluconobacter thailandicus F149-1 = NBRC 100600]|uniref:Cobaltochelatase subunit CobN n=1 Tax=Gluconobacter thailandicus NBRC 3257 TaxID=1381097 RepID=A0ABQ0IZR1_GLUTH|nr:cobaltochelatase subunit CobN [Gluconobacter thailandicus]KXV52846.1 cobalamin biosynthesis protein CobN [Gluconobacter thailandicus]GAC88163.1 cobaltochelatase subunit CobN [Gluconobacter thailandicus NBRC 3255]GAD27690.1 cobaltochelatase subunit CobN [Gluconobacter thailandicus NBRC 3257]GAN93159.1 cobaltochelatase subunit CobN [Gluconobacter thailandicus F149-1 = NBRC 100600]GEL86942.1 cobaltochelatase subunit CobN [Gluconobacter thailandicus F149-1 = NBRC 100600]